MVMIGFSIPELKHKILIGDKRCTIRKPRKRAWKSNDILQLYMYPRQKTMHLLFETPLKLVKRLRFPQDFSEEIAIADGFNNLEQCLAWFRKTHRKYINGNINPVFDWIHWDYNKRELPKTQRLLEDF